MAKTQIKTGAFTLVEVVIAISIFAVLAILSIQIFSNISFVSRELEVQQYVFSEGEAAMEKIIRQVQASAIDYNEYYSRMVLAETYYGQNYGAYGATFYDPGSDGPLRVVPWDSGGDGVVGTECDSDSEFFFTEDCTDFDTSSYDSNTGQHYYDDPADASAFCEGSLDCNDVGLGLQSQLYLIDSAGTKKTIFVPELKDDGGYVISMLEMDGVDVDGDATSDFWQCADGYDCSGKTVEHYLPDWPAYDDSEDYYVSDDSDLEDGSIEDHYFEPITPSDIDIIGLSFYIIPLEDPYKAFAESVDVIMQHPRVIVVMTVAPSSSLGEGLSSDWTLTLQGVASTAVFDSVPSEYRGEWRWE